MRPDTPQLPTNDPRGSVTPPARDEVSSRDAAVNVIRGQIEQLYSRTNEDTTASQPAAPAQTQPQVAPSLAPTAVESPQPVATPAQSAAPYTSPQPQQPETAYDRTHTESHHGTLSKDWRHYHGEWQQYYQKYYEQYYHSAVQQNAQVYSEQVAKIQQTAPSDETMSEQEAIQDLRSELLQKVQKSAKKVRKSRHFMPVMAAMSVMLVFLFLQYNTMLFGYIVAYASPGNVKADNIIVDPTVAVAVDEGDTRLIIPKINVDIRVDYGATPDHDSQMAAMKEGVAYFGIPGANSRPGQKGNIPIAGHSSNDFTDTGAAKFIFARLDQLQKGDTFYLNYNKVRYTYSVTNTQVVKPTELDKLQIGADKPYATLITCTPLGTAEKRLLVTGEQVSPSPTAATDANKTNSSAAPQNMTGTSPSLIQRLFGAN